ncbi:MAG TPA: MBL fold metallo-hydrolase [Gemmatimonadaceae bacterium]|nr:MBL fold metallo-hydrolase [Gemmatimonadaceae bacterium]
MLFAGRALVALVLVSGSLSAQSPALDGAVRAMGGKERILAVRTLVLEGRGENLNFGQNHTPFAESKFEVTSFRRAYDFRNRRWFQDQTRVPRFNTANVNPQRQRTGLDGAGGGVAYNVLPNDAMTRASDQVAADRAHEFVLHPIGFAQAAYAPGSEVSEAPASGEMRRVRLTAGGATYSMYVDPRTSLPVRMERVVYQPMLGDVTMAVELSDWRAVSGVQLPMRLTQKYDDLFTLADITVATAQVNADVGNIAATDSIRSVVVQAGQPAAPTIAIDSIAPGVWSVAGQSHHTIVIEQSGQLVLVEAPQSEARTLAAIAAARALRPDKPANVLVNTHHHFDHSGGLRAAISQGFTIVTHEGNRDFYERVLFPRRHAIQQDRLGQNPKPMRLMPVPDRYVRADSVRPVEVYAVPSDHSGSMLVVYLPNERILIQADLYNPPAPNAVNPVFPFAKALVENVQRRGLAVDRVVGIHGRPVPWSDVVAAAQR